MKASLLIVLMVFGLSYSFAAERENNEKKQAESQVLSLKGQVIDQQTKEALVGVKVVLEGTKKVAYTDFDGNYQFDNMKAGEYQLTASYISYEKATVEHVKPSLNNGPVNFSLRTAN